MTLEIYFADLTIEAQARYLEFFRLDNASDGNLDSNIIPLFQLDSSDIDWDDELEAVVRDT
jgi:uncharacterized protein YqkB